MIARFVRRLFEPTQSIASPELRRRIAMFNILLFIYMTGIACLMVALLANLGQSGGSPASNFGIIFAALVIFATAFFLGKTKYYGWAGVLFGVGVYSGSLLAIFTDPTLARLTAVFPFFAVPPLIGAFALPYRYVVILTFSSVASTISVSGYLGFLNALPVHVFLSFQIIVCLVVLIGSVVRDKDRATLESERARVFHASRVGALGEMAGGIAHEMNTPLGTVDLRLTQALRLLAKPEPDIQSAIRCLEAVRATSDQIARIVKGMNAFARIGFTDPFQETPIAAILEDVRALCSEQMNANHIQFVVESIDAGLVAQCRRVQICQILINLIHNAQQALVGRRDGRIQMSAASVGNSVEIVVCDNGPGVAGAIVKRIFDPFFTTKGVGEGTGLGLSVSIGIARDHGGDLFLDRSEKGARFVLKFPKVHREQSAA